MITQEKLKIYKSYSGDIDAWARSGRRYEKAAMEDSDWYLIEQLIDDLKLVNNGLAADSYANEINIRLTGNCNSKETIDQIKALAGEQGGKKGLFSRILSWFRGK